jgi:hypothetical protein
MGIALLNYTGKQLIPAYNAEDTIPISQNFVPNLTISQGQVVASIQNATTNDVQTLTINATGGTFTMSMVGVDGNSYTTAALPWNIATGPLVTALTALAESAGFHLAVPTITGGPGGTGPLVVTSGGTAASYPMPLATTTASLTGGAGTAVNVHTTTGCTIGKLTAYNGTKIANPTTVPTVADSATAGSFVALSSYGVAYTYTNALGGETLPSPVVLHTLASGKTSFTAAPAEGAMPTGATGINYYVDGQLCAQATAVTALQISNFTTLAGINAPSVNTAFVATDGSQIPVGIAPANFKTDALGRVVYGNVPLLAPFITNDLTVPVYVIGFFFTQDLVGLDANAVSILGRLVGGTISTGVLRMN